ncbi:MAG: Fic family protein [Micrococcaceae bacterium]
MLEAQASSEIENIVTTTDELFRSLALDGQDDTLQTKETLRYREALGYGFNSILDRPLTAKLTTEICTILRGIKTSYRKIPGTRIGNPVTKKIIYSPPEGEKVIYEKLNNWENFLHLNDTLHPLIVMAICHYQFEAIHPFEDGNGRTGRIINVLILIEKGLLTSPLLYLSQYIIENKQEYYRLLNKVTSEAAWEEWIIFMLKGVHKQAQRTLNRIKEVRNIQIEMGIEIQEKLPKIYSKELLDILFEFPYCRTNDLTDAGIGTRQTASRYLNELVENDFLETITVGRKKIYINTRFMDALRQNFN